MTPVRVGLIGARRARQGLGPFLARDLRAAGAEVPCFQVTSEESRAEADAQLQETAGVKARGYLDLATLLAEEPLDALVVSSPHEAHAEALEAAADAGLHVLCEKPLVWGMDDLAGSAAACVAAFEARDLQLWENCQWPWTLPALERLHPGATQAPPRRFAMRLQPAASGAKMLADSLPHPISLLQRLSPGPDPEVHDASFSSTAADAERVEVRFRYATAQAETDCAVELRPTRSHPREVAVGIDGREAMRRVSAPDYRLSFQDGERSVPLEDPMSELVSDFVASVRAGADPERATRHSAIVERSALLARLRDAWLQSAG
jgi:predicted dehydrogenase